MFTINRKGFVFQAKSGYGFGCLFPTPANVKYFGGLKNLIVNKCSGLTPRNYVLGEEKPEQVTDVEAPEENTQEEECNDSCDCEEEVEDNDTDDEDDDDDFYYEEDEEEEEEKKEENINKNKGE